MTKLKKAGHRPPITTPNIQFSSPGLPTFHVPITYQFFKRYENLCQVTSTLIFCKPSVFKTLRGYDKL